MVEGVASRYFSVKKFPSQHTAPDTLDFPDEGVQKNCEEPRLPFAFLAPP
jgi:hypothetical protein